MKEVVFYYDFSSPYAYLGATQIERVAQEQGATVRWRPILVGALFNAIGTPNVPLDDFPAAKRSYMLRDLMHWAAHWRVQLRWPSRFPMRTVAPLRLALAVEAAGGDIAAVSHALFAPTGSTTATSPIRRCCASSGISRSSSRRR